MKFNVKKIAKVFSLILIISALILPMNACANNKEEEIYLFDSKGEGLLAVKHEDGEWGFINKKGKEVIKCKYDDAYPFSNGLAAVCDGGDWIYIDSKGKVKINGDFQEAYPFDNKGYALVKEDDEYGFIDKKGDWKIKNKYEDLYPFNQFDLALAKEDGKFGLIDRNGKTVLDFDYDNISEFTDDGYALVSITNSETDETLFGLIDRKGEEILEVEYSNAYYNDNMFNCGLAAFRKTKKTEENGVTTEEELWGFVDPKGNTVVKFKYDDVTTFAENGLAAVCEYDEKNDEYKYGFIDKNGDMVIDADYDDTHGFSKNGLAAVCKINDKGEEKWGFIDKNGNYVIDNDYSDAESFDDNGVAIIQKDNEYGVINKNGEEIIRIKYADISIWEKWAIAKSSNGNYILFDLKGNEVDGEKYDEISFISRGYFSVKEDDEYAVLGSNGKIKVDFTDDYKFYLITNDNYILVENNKDHIEILDMKGEEAIDMDDYVNVLPYYVAATYLGYAN